MLTQEIYFFGCRKSKKRKVSKIQKIKKEAYAFWPIKQVRPRIIAKFYREIVQPKLNSFPTRKTSSFFF